MAIAITIASQVETGEEFSFSGTGFTASGELTVAVHTEGISGLSIQSVTLAADLSGDLASGVLSLVCDMPGHCDISITDVTAATTVTERVEVFEVGGV